MSRIRIIFNGMSELAGNDQLLIIMMAGEKRQRQVGFVCDKMTAVQIGMRVKKVEGISTMLPEVLCSILSRLSGATMELNINTVDNGQYRCFLCFGPGWIEPIPVRISDAVLLSVIADVPVYMDEKLFARQSTDINKDDRRVSLPINSLSTEMLQEALDKAIREEKYELAALLRDEQLRRETK